MKLKLLVSYGFYLLSHLLLMVTGFGQVEIFAQTWYPLKQGLTSPQGVEVRSLFADSIDNSIYAGGSFLFADGRYTNGIARWDGTQWHPLGKGIIDSVGNVGKALSIVRYKNAIYAGGIFTVVDSNKVALGIARWADNKWQNIGENPITGRNSPASLWGKLRVLNDTLYAMGSFDSIGGIAAQNIAKFDGVKWYSVVPNYAVDRSINSSTINDALFYKGELYIAGSFQTTIGMQYDQIMRWDGKQFKPLGVGFQNDNSWVNAMKLYKGNLYVGGYFYSLSGGPGNCIARWDGNAWYNVDSGVSNQPLDMVVYKNNLWLTGALYGAGANWATPNTEHFAFWDGNQWHGLLSGKIDYNRGGTITMSVLKDSLYVGGTFDSINNVLVNNVAKYRDNLSSDVVNFVELEALHKQINVYPNPFNNILHFYFSDHETIGKIQVFNELGQKVFMIENVNTAQISTAKWGKGLYLLEYSTTIGVFTRKILKE